MALIRNCPSCHSERPLSESHCQNIVDAKPCYFSLMTVMPVQAGNRTANTTANTESPIVAIATCPNGHAISPGDLMCGVCGADIEEDSPPIIEIEQPTQQIGDWIIENPIPSSNQSKCCFAVRHIHDQSPGFLTWYQEGVEPDRSIYDVLRRMDKDHIPDLLQEGRFEERGFEVFEWITDGTLEAAGHIASQHPETINRIVDELGRALRDFAEVGLRHRDICPRTILIRTTDPLDLAITDFGSARLSDFDLDAVAPLELTRYSAPEAIVGGVSAASDWWSLGMIALEQITEGDCFEGINDKAFMIHIVTRGVPIPENIDPHNRMLLQGLLARDPHTRWQWPEVSRWLQGETVPVPPEHGLVDESASQIGISLGGVTYTSPQRLALAAAEESNWQHALAIFQSGELATWLAQSFGDTPVTSAIRNLQVAEVPSVEWRMALALMRLNTDLPLTYGGNIVTPAWLLQFPQEAAELITGTVADQLEAMKRETWLVRLHYRNSEIRDYAKLLEIEIDAEKYAINMLATSRANLDAELARFRKHFPSSSHTGIGTLFDKQRLNEQDIILLLSAAIDQFTPLAALVDETLALAEWHKMPMEKEISVDWLVQRRRDLYAALDQRILGFARCGISHLDQWADDFRLERRIKPARAVLLLSIPEEQWLKPDNQDYSANILGFFHKRMTNSVMRGPLMRLTISKTSSRIDLTEFETALCPAESILNHLLSRNEKSISIDPEVLQKDAIRENRMWRMVSAANNYRRDTGIDCLYLGFPFLLWSDKNKPSVRPRVAPILLWPVKLNLRIGARGSAQISFDRGREEVRLNPALEKLVGSEEIDNWKTARKELLGREHINIQQVADAFGQFASLRGRSLTAHPAVNTTLELGAQEIACSAVIFNARFSGQAISEDLLNMRNRPLAATALEPMFKMYPGEEPSLNESDQNESSASQFTVVASDPSQEKAVIQSRQWPGVVVEGPPGTGKSQTIVNIVADCIGRGEHVLVVCEKQAALKVVEKRLRAENLGNRLLCISDVNRDRQTVIRTIREQLDTFFQSDETQIKQLKAERKTLAEQIDRIAEHLDKRHQQLYEFDTLSQYSYRNLLSELVAHTENTELNTVSLLKPIPRLQGVLANVSSSDTNILVDEVGALISDWHASNYENSSLKAFVQFDANTAVVSDIAEKLKTLVDLEKQRDAAIKQYPSNFDLKGIEQCADWIKKYSGDFVTSAVKRELQIHHWFELFSANGKKNELPEKLLSEINQLQSELNGLNPLHDDKRYFSKLNTSQFSDLKKMTKVAKKYLRGLSFLDKINPFLWPIKRDIKKLFEKAGDSLSAESLSSFIEACILELKLKRKRSKIKKYFGILRSDSTFSFPAPLDQLDLTQFKTVLSDVANDVREAKHAIKGIVEFPLQVNAKDYLASNSPDKQKQFLLHLNAAARRHKARAKVQAAMATISEYLEKDVASEIENNIVTNTGKIALFESLLVDLPALIPFQRYRARLNTSLPVLGDVMASLQGNENELQTCSKEQKSAWSRFIVRREALEGWRSRIETAQPLLAATQKEIERKEQKLEQLLSAMQKINRKLLEQGIDRQKFGSRTQWRDITGLRGVRYKKLREFFDHGQDLGLSKLRPIWLMNPDVVSQLLPLQAGLFDVVIFDEASQIMVESAVPSLYRAKRVVVSGDEKQMPPSSFFNANVNVDEEDADEALEEDASEAEVIQHEETWNRREIKDCPDLLVLSKAVLPVTTLKIHYRSEYRALINFSNAAFYNGDLHVPALHPEHEVRENRPLEVRPIMGCYSEQSNKAEAEEIIAILQSYWEAPFAERPSIGVVTFNKKQAELIDSAIQLHAENNEQFYGAYLQEQERMQNEEDMSFFVKNVENVQGDERDIILFSTTFGRNEHGSFRRNFGALGHRGGERRLNVAVTRARKKVVVVTSMPVREISDMLATDRKPSKPRDYLQAYLDYATNMSNGEFDAASRTANRLKLNSQQNRDADTQQKDAIVNSVNNFVESLGYTTTYMAGSRDLFRIDLAILDPITKLYGFGIECDAPNEALLKAAKYRDIWRRNVLSKSIKHLHRINSREWYESNDYEKNRLKEAIILQLKGKEQ